jgi:hypothetical protein
VYVHTHPCTYISSLRDLDYNIVSPFINLSKMRVITFYSLALLGAAHAQNQTRGAAMMRFACSQLTVERLDPLVNPGLEGSPHTHQIVGGNSFQAEMRPESYNLVAQSTCTTCTFSEDFR